MISLGASLPQLAQGQLQILRSTGGYDLEDEDHDEDEDLRLSWDPIDEGDCLRQTPFRLMLRVFFGGVNPKTRSWQII